MMRTDAHYCLSQFFIRQYLQDANRFSRKLFLFGSIEPDLNLLTWPGKLNLKHFFDGHNFAFSEKRIKALLLKGGMTSSNPAAAFMLGILLHYLVDAFTYPHQSTFNGNFARHLQYESEQAVVFCQYLETYQLDPDTPLIEIDRIFPYIKAQHLLYLNEKPGIATDCRYITAVSSQIVRSLLAHKEQEVLQVRATA